MIWVIYCQLIYCRQINQFWEKNQNKTLFHERVNNNKQLAQYNFAFNQIFWLNELT